MKKCDVGLVKFLILSALQSSYLKILSGNFNFINISNLFKEVFEIPDFFFVGSSGGSCHVEDATTTAGYAS